MLRLLIVVAVVVGLALWLLKGRRSSAPPARREGNAADRKAATMVACAHCGLHLPKPDATFDAEGRSYCGEPHRVAGPR